tara:strand:+ start:3057 stop:4004 length:948 start_codon:yes stop_codon:yes gene_type:complete
MKKKYLINLIITILGLFFFTIFLNYTIDPLNYLRFNPYSFFSSERELKARMIEEDLYDGMVMGTSKVTYLHTEDIDLEGKILNAAFSGAMPEEMLKFLEEKNPDIKWIAIGFDWFTFSETHYPYEDYSSEKKMFSKQFDEILAYLVSVNTSGYSLITIFKMFSKTNLLYTRWGSRTLIEKEIKHSMVKDYSYDDELQILEDRYYSRFKISKRRINDVRAIQEWATKKNILFIGWMNPLHEDVYKILINTIHPDALLLPQALSEEITHFIDLSKLFSDKDYFWRTDPFHYLSSTGEYFFEKHIVPLINEKMVMELK